MSDTPHLKCPCQHCGASIEFPDHGAGSNVQCPHCHEYTTLFVPSGSLLQTEPQTEAGTDEAGDSATPSKAVGGLSRGLITAVLLLAVAAVIGGALFLMRQKPPSESANETTSSTADNPGTRSSDGATTSQTTTPSSTSASGAKTPKSLDDLKVSSITLEKAKGSSLVYAVGVLRNQSDHQRFGVNIEIELSDAKGISAGKAKDYRNVIEPRQEWRFRALVLDSRAASGKLGSIREEE